MEKGVRRGPGYEVDLRVGFTDVGIDQARKLDVLQPFTY